MGKNAKKMVKIDNFYRLFFINVNFTKSRRRIKGLKMSKVHNKKALSLVEISNMFISNGKI